MSLKKVFKSICDNCLFQLLLGVVSFISLSYGLALGCYCLIERWPSLYWILAGIVILLLTPVVLVALLCIIGSLLRIIIEIKITWRKKTTQYPAPVADNDFLRGCGIAPDSQEAEVALKLRRTFADCLYCKHGKFTQEDIAPDMTCDELCSDVDWHIYYHDDMTFKSIGYYVVQDFCKGKVPKKAFEQLIQPEKSSRVTMRELFTNYLSVIMPYWAGAGETEAKISPDDKIFLSGCGVVADTDEAGKP